MPEAAQEFRLLRYSILTELNPVVFRQVTNKNKQHFLLFHDPLAALKVKLRNYIFVFTVIIITFTVTLGAAAIFTTAITFSYYFHSYSRTCLTLRAFPECLIPLSLYI